MTEIKMIDIIAWFLGIGGWVLFLPMLIYALFNGGWVGAHFNLFYEIWFEILLVSVIVSFLIYYVIKKIKSY